MKREAPHLAAGREAERLARLHLERAGLSMRDHNYRAPTGELDLVMEEGDTLVFVEVRLRRNPRFGGGIASVDGRKREKIVRTAAHYLQRHRLSHRQCRFDVISVGDGDPPAIQWLRGAFEA
ncbi:MAG TPA: YraN family protein [Thiotrichales bacterium]|nr:YraN family protein [Thiotrichales bacterium]